MSSPSTGIGWGVSWSQVVVGFCRTPSLQCGIFPTLGDIIGGQNVAQRVMGNILQCWNWSTMFGILPDQLFNIVHIVRWQCETIWCQTFATSKSNTWQFAIVSCDGRCDVWNSFFLQTSHWHEYLVCGESKCPIDQVFSWHGLFINITASYRYNNGKGGFFCPISIILQTNYSQIPRLLSKLGLTGAWNALKKYSQNGKGCRWKNVNWKFG